MVSPIYHQRHLAHPSWILSSKTIRTRKSSSPWSYSPLLTPHMDTRVFRRIFGNRVRIRGKSIEGCGCSDKAAYKSATRRDEVRTQREEGGGEQALEGWTDGGRARGWIATREKERGKRKGRRAEGLLAEGDEKSEEEGGKKGETGAQCYRCIRVKLVLSTFLLLFCFFLPWNYPTPRTHSRLCSTNRTVFGATYPSPSPSPSRPTCIRIHTRIHTLYVCIHVWVTRAGGAGGTIIQHPTLDPLIIHTCIHTYNTYTYTWAKLTFAYQRDRSPPSTVSATFFFFCLLPRKRVSDHLSPPLLPLPPTSSSGIIDFAWRPDSRIRSAGTRC